jgi:hypothetical protein
MNALLCRAAEKLDRTEMIQELRRGWRRRNTGGQPLEASLAASGVDAAREPDAAETADWIDLIGSDAEGVQHQCA